MGQTDVCLGRGQRGDEIQAPPACAGAPHHVPRRRRVSISLESLGGDETAFSIANVYINGFPAFAIMRYEEKAL